MEYILATLILFICIFTIYKLFTTSSIVWLIAGVLGLFSIGYYVLPVFFKDYSGLSRVIDHDLSEVLLMCFIFFFFLVLGIYIFDKIFRNYQGIELPWFDKKLFNNSKIIFYICFAVWITYYSNNAITSYSAENFEKFFHEKGTFDGLLAALSGYAMAGMAISIVIEYIKNRSIPKIFIILFAIVIILLLAGGQRLAVITPIFMLVGAFTLYNLHKKGLRIMMTGILVLILVSPFMVFVREFQGGKGKEKILEASQKYSANNSNILEKSFISIMERADLLKVMIRLKKEIDKENYNFDHFQYIYSVIASYIPKFIFNDKPYPLSDTGDIWGEISVEAWVLMIGHSTGSLSAFGSISAYREGGYFWVAINGFLVGLLYVLIAVFFGRGGHMAKFLFISIFVTLCIKNVPPSFFYLLVFIAPLFMTYFLVYFINFIFSRIKFR